MNQHGNIKHGGHGTLTYSRWKSMMQRCNDPKARNYPRYGGSGIKVCERWHDFASFLADMGECPSKIHTVERLKGDVGYESPNCRWATKAEQSRNRPSFCVQLTYKGVTKNATDWATEMGISPNTLFMRIRLGWSTERALTAPLKPHGNRPSRKSLPTV